MARLRKKHIGPSATLAVNLQPTICRSCELHDVCPNYDQDSMSCRFIDAAVKDFIGSACTLPYVEERDKFAVRNLAALHASILITELYFKKYGIIVISLWNNMPMPEYRQLYKDWARMVRELNNGLSKFGLTPASRAALNYVEGRTNAGALLDYIEKKAEVLKDGAESSGEDKHRRFLQRSTTAESPAPGDASSDSKESLRNTFNEEPGRALELDAVGTELDGEWAEESVKADT